MDIKGMGEQNIHALIEGGYIHDIGDIFNLAVHRDELIAKGVIGKEKNTDKLLAAIEKDGPAAAADAADWAEDEEDLAQALAVGNAADDAPEQDAPDLDAASHDVLFPGVEQPAARPEPPAHDDGDTTQIDLGSWQTGAAQEQAPAGERKWGRLLGLFAQNQDDPEDD